MEIDNALSGRIIHIVPAKKLSTFRLSDQTLDVIQRLADRLDRKRPDVVELAVFHLAGTLRSGQPIHMEPPPPEPRRRHKTPPSAA